MENNKNLLEDFQREQQEKEEILKRPMNSLNKLALENVIESELTQKIKKSYEGFSLSQFLNHISKKD